MSKYRNTNYDVGYKKPPEHTRFKPGQSGNRKGRPKNAAADFIGNLFEEYMQKIEVSENGKRSKITKNRAIAKRIINGALSAEPRFVSAFMKLLPLMEKHSEKMQLINKPDIKITFVYSDSQIEDYGKKLAKRLLWEALEDIKKTGKIPNIEEPPDPLIELKKDRSDRSV